MGVLTTYLVIVLCVQLLSMLMLAGNYRDIFQLETGTYPHPPDPLPKVSIVVPARDEELNIENCARSLLAQDYPDYELVIVNDRSSDATGEILDRLAEGDNRLKVVHGVKPPEGWLGKNHALYQGVAHASGEFLLFVDADTDLSPTCLTQAVAHAEEKQSGLLTLLPKLVNVTFWERVIQPAIGQLVLAWFPSKLINDPKVPKVASANGPFLLFRKTVYEAIGGHEAVKGDIVEDLTLAKRTKASGHRLTYVLGTELQRLRMYTSFREIWNGWSKNFYAGVGGSLVGACFGALVLFALFVLPWFLLPVVLLAAWSGVAGAGAASVAAFGVVTVAVVWRKLVDHLYKGDSGASCLQWLGFLVICAILLNSTYRFATGREVIWKGRSERIDGS